MMGRSKTHFVRRALRRFVRRRDGAAAVEFALIATPFFLLLTALGEVSLMSFAQTNLDLAVNDTSRQIRTGEAQTAGRNRDQIHTEICERINAIMNMDCGGNLFLDVQTFENFGEIDDPAPNGEVNEDDLRFEPGGPGDIVLVRVFYRWQVITPFFQTIFSNVGGGNRLITSTVLFRNEPWPEDAG